MDLSDQIENEPKMFDGCCLVRLGLSKEYKVIPFHKDEMFIGRNIDSDFCISSPSVSRKHALVKKTPNKKWTISDCNSLNGLFINGIRLLKTEARILNDGDTLSFGCNEVDSFVYAFKDKYDERELNRKKIKLHHEGKELKVLPPSMTAAQYVKSEQIKDLLKEKNELQIKLERMKDALAEKTATELSLRDQLRQEKLLSNLMFYQLDRSNTSRASEPNQDLEMQKASMKAHLEAECKLLIEKKEEIEMRLLSGTPEDKNRWDIDQELRLEKRLLESLINSREVKQKLLDEKFKVLAEENVAMEKVKQDLQRDFMDMMEMELQCCICSELFIEATTLNCSHTFCLKCICEWMTQKKKQECPMCRVEIKMTTRSSVVDSYIDRMIEKFSPDLMARRLKLVTERNISKPVMKKILAKRQSHPNRRIATAITFRNSRTNPIVIQDTD